MTNYIFGFTIYKYNKKVKIDYFTLPVEVIDGCYGSYLSCVSKSRYDFKKLKKFNNKKCFIDLKKEFKKVDFKMVYYTDKENLEEVEKYILPKIYKWLSSKLLFRKKFRRALKQRVERITKS